MKQTFNDNQEEQFSPQVIQTEEAAQPQSGTLDSETPLVLYVRKSIRKYNRMLFGAMIFFGVAFFTIVGISRWLIQNVNPYLAIPFALTTILGACVAFSRPRAILRKAKDAIKSVAQSEDFESLGAMIEMLNLEKEANVTDATVSVTNILSKVQPEHAGLLSSRHRFALRNILNRNIEMVLYKDLSALFSPVSLQNEANRRAINLRVAIMKGFAQIGTEAEVSCLERWVSIEAKSEAQRILTSTAMECLPLLKGRVAQLSDQNTLLRASDANHHDPSLLLRPSREVAEPSEQLLRPNEVSLEES